MENIGPLQSDLDIRKDVAFSDRNYSVTLEWVDIVASVQMP